MDAYLKPLADVSMALTAAEEALEAGSTLAAREATDEAAEQLDALRGAWPQMSKAERQIVGQTAKPLRERLDAVRGRLPRLVALGEISETERALHLVEDASDGGPDGDPEPPAAA